MSKPTVVQCWRQGEIKRGRDGERERERNRERERETQGERQRERERQIERDRETDIYIYMNTCMHTYIHTLIHSFIHTYILAYLHTYIHTYIHTDTETEGDRDRWTDTPASKPMVTWQAELRGLVTAFNFGPQCSLEPPRLYCMGRTNYQRNFQGYDPTAIFGVWNQNVGRC